MGIITEAFLVTEGKEKARCKGKPVNSRMHKVFKGLFGKIRDAILKKQP